MKTDRRFRRFRLLPLALLAAAILCLALGAAGGQPAQMWQKAVNICLECIGVG